MRHQKAGRKFGRKSPHRRAMFSNMVSSLIRHGRIETTEAKAKELRRFAEPTITWAVSVADIEMKGRKKQSDEDKARFVHAVRMARRVVKDRDVLEKLFHEVGPGFVSRPGGYTRVLKTRHRNGDAAPMAFIELMPAEVPKKSTPKAKSEPKAEAKPAKAEKKPAKAEKKAPAKKAPAKKSKSKKSE